MEHTYAKKHPTLNSWNLEETEVILARVVLKKSSVSS